MVLKKIKQILEFLTSKLGLLILFVTTHIVFALMMIFTFPKINGKVGTKAFDLKTFSYSLKEATEIVEKLDQPTVDLYLFPQLFLLDILYPFLLAFLLHGLLKMTVKLGLLNEKLFFSKILFLPWMGMLFDYLENFSIALMISKKADLTLIFVRIASLTTILKSLFTTICWLIVIFCACIWANRKFISNKKSYDKNSV